MSRKLLYCFFTLYCFYCNAQSFPDIKFSHLTEKDGLSNNTVRSIAQDAQGFIWFATDNGLNRFDGNRIKTFYHHPLENNSLVNNQLIQLEADKKNNLWISTVEGLSFFDRAQNTFINFKDQNSKGPASLHVYHNNAFFTDAQNNEWITANAGFYKFNDRLQHTYVPLDNQNSYSKLIPEQTSGLYADRQNIYWTYAGSLLFRLNDEKAAADTFNSPSGFVISFCQDDYKNYWAGTFGNGLYQFNDTKRSFTQATSIPGTATIYSITPWKDQDNFYWLAVGTDKGFFLFDPITQKSFQYIHNTLDNFSLSGDAINKVFVDRQNILWLATNNGISYIEPSKQLIETWSLSTGQRNNYLDNPEYPYSFFEDDNRYVISKWNQPGLYEFDKSGSLLQFRPAIYSATGKADGHTNNLVFYIIKDAEQNMWFSTNDGLLQYDKKQRRYTLFKAEYCDKLCGFRNIAVQNDTTWWIRTRNNGSNGIFAFNPKRKQFIKHFISSGDCKNCLPDRLMDMIVTHRGDVFTTPLYKGLYVYDASTSSFIPAVINNLDAHISTTFDCLAEDKKGNLWIGTANGLFAYDPVSKKIIADYTPNAILGGIAILKICFDENENIWMNTKRGLYCLLKDRKNIFNFTTNDGLPNNVLEGFLSKTKDGQMLCGANGYVVRFNPNELLRSNVVNAKTFFSEATSNNKTLPFEKTAANSKKIILAPEENILSIDFAVLNFDNAATNRYFYKLDGAMNDWKENENGQLTFYNLPPETYTLHVQGANKYGTRFSGEDVLTIVVQPHWCQTTWFKLLAILMLLLLVTFIILRRIKQIRKSAELKQKITEAEMMALRAQMNPHFIFNCMNSIDGLITSNRKEEAQAFLQKFSKLIRLVLENSQYQQVPLQQDLKALELYIALEVIRSNHSFNYEFIVDKALQKNEFKIPPLLLQPYIENAIVHGLRNKENGEGKLLVCIKKDADQIKIIIEDNGIGRVKAGLLNEENKKPYQQLGMKVTGKRIALLQAMNSNKVAFNIEDIYNGEETGTRVTIVLPVQINFE